MSKSAAAGTSLAALCLDAAAMDEDEVGNTQYVLRTQCIYLQANTAVVS